jgi:type VI secretion system protein ImpM
LFFRRSSKRNNAFDPFIGAFGKIAGAGDFVRIAPRGNATLDAFEHWLINATRWADSSGATSAEERYAAPTVGFLFSPKPATGGLLVGALRWSRDSVGRDFPLAIFAAVNDDSLARTPHLVPLVLRALVEPFATQLTTNVTSADALREWLAGCAVPDVGQAHVHTAYDAWCTQTYAEAAWAALFGGHATPGARYAIHTIAEALAPFRHRDDPETQLGAVLPIGAPQTIDWAASVALWMDIARRVGGWQSNIPTTFWTLSPNTPRRVLIALGDPHASALAEITLGRGDADQTCRLLGRDAAPTPGYQPLPVGTDAALANAHSSLSDVLATLSSFPR